MIDFYSELKKFKKAPEPKELKNMINKERKDFIDIAIKILLDNNYRNSGEF